jgi:hypothetical protein
VHANEPVMAYVVGGHYYLPPRSEQPYFLADMDVGFSLIKFLILHFPVRSPQLPRGLQSSRTASLVHHPAPDQVRIRQDWWPSHYSSACLDRRGLRFATHASHLQVTTKQVPAKPYQPCCFTEAAKLLVTTYQAWSPLMMTVESSMLPFQRLRPSLELIENGFQGSQRGRAPSRRTGSTISAR